LRLALPGTSRVAAALLAAATLVVGLAIGYTLAVRAAPPPREPALLWDDYILAVASLYQRDGDLTAAKERLRRLSTDDAGASVAALAAIYVPDGRLGDSQAAALRDLAMALTGRSLPPMNDFTQSKTAPSQPEAGPTDALAALARNQLFWGLVALLSFGVVGTTLIRSRRASGKGENANAIVETAPAKSSLAPIVAAPRAAVQVATPPKASARGNVEKESRAAPKGRAISISQTFVYEGDEDSIEEMATITDPLSGRTVAGCGLTNGPRAGGAGGGFVGFLVWLHEMGSHELPQTLGLVAEGSGDACKAAIGEWADYARVDELVVARPGVVRTFETRRLQAAVSVVDLAQTRPGRAKHKVFRRIEVRLDIAFKEGSAIAPGFGSR
jgi:hypothetical protein